MFLFHCGDVRYSLYYRNISFGKLKPAQVTDRDPPDLLAFTSRYIAFKRDDFPYIQQYVPISILVANLLKHPGFNG